MLIWMIYAVAVGLLLTGVAALTQPLRRRRSGGGRWVWAAALVATAIIPLATTLWPAAERVNVPAIARLADPTVIAGESVEVTAEAPPLWSVWGPRVDRFAALGWGAATLVLLGYLGGSAFRLRQDLSRWPRRRLDGVVVRVGPVPGPAVVGVRSPEIVVPRWVLELSEEDRRLILAHERSHLEARDPLLMVGAWILAALTPWNPGSWMQLRRLRGSVEEDCDQRVVRGRPWAEARRYGELLVDVGERVAPGAPLAPAAFAEGGSHLERRLRTMFELYPPLSRVRTILAAVGAVGLAAAVFLIPGPSRSALLGPEEGPGPEAYTRAPELINPMEVREAMRREYPPLLLDAGIGGTTEMWVYVDAEGRPIDLRVQETSGHAQLDEAALRVATIMSFTPAVNDAGPVAAWISVPLRFAEGALAVSPPTFELPPTPEEIRESRPQEPVIEERPLTDGPTFTPYTVGPDLKNREVVGPLLQSSYPPLLRDAGIGGSVRVWFLIDETGAVVQTRIESSSGHQELDEAALEVAAAMEFEPALNRDRKVAVWVAIPISFQVR